MNLYTLSGKSSNAAFLGWDTTQLIVVVATDEDEARKLADEDSMGAENNHDTNGNYVSERQHHFLDPNATDCDLVDMTKPQIICSDVNWG